MPSEEFGLVDKALADEGFGVLGVVLEDVDVAFGVDDDEEELIVGGEEFGGHDGDIVDIFAELGHFVGFFLENC